MENYVLFKSPLPCRTEGLGLSEAPVWPLGVHRRSRGWVRALQPGVQAEGDPGLGERLGPHPGSVRAQYGLRSILPSLSGICPEFQLTLGLPSCQP